VAKTVKYYFICKGATKLVTFGLFLVPVSLIILICFAGSLVGRQPG